MIQIEQIIQIVQNGGDEMLELLGKQDVYVEVAEKYKQYITSGIYVKGDKLPSVRTVGAELGVNPNTVAKSYALLEREGYVKALPKKGAYVIYEGVCKDNKKDTSKIRLALEELKAQGVSFEEITDIVKEVWDKDD